MNAQPCLDLDFVRSQFPAFAEPSLQGQAFFENAGGSYVCAQVIRLLTEYYRRLKVQPYYHYPAATEAGQPRKTPTSWRWRSARLLSPATKSSSPIKSTKQTRACSGA